MKEKESVSLSNPETQPETAENPHAQYILQLESALQVAKLASITNWLTPAQLSAIRGKIPVNEVPGLTAETPGNSDSVIAYFVYKARKEADDRIFSISKAGYISTLLQWYMALGSPDKTVSDTANLRILNVAENTTPSQAYELAAYVKKELLRGKTAMLAEQDTAFRAMCLALGVDPQNVK